MTLLEFIELFSKPNPYLPNSSYKSDSNNISVKYQNDFGWNDLSSDKISESMIKKGYKYVILPGSKMDFVFYDGAKRDGGNSGDSYSVKSPGIYLIENGNITDTGSNPSNTGNMLPILMKKNYGMEIFSMKDFDKVYLSYSKINDKRFKIVVPDRKSDNHYYAKFSPYIGNVLKVYNEKGELTARYSISKTKELNSGYTGTLKLNKGVNFAEVSDEGSKAANGASGGVAKQRNITSVSTKRTTNSVIPAASGGAAEVRFTQGESLGNGVTFLTVTGSKVCNEYSSEIFDYGDGSIPQNNIQYVSSYALMFDFLINDKTVRPEQVIMKCINNDYGTEVTYAAVKIGNYVEPVTAVSKIRYRITVPDAAIDYCFGIQESWTVNNITDMTLDIKGVAAPKKYNYDVPAIINDRLDLRYMSDEPPASITFITSGTYFYYGQPLSNAYAYYGKDLTNKTYVFAIYDDIGMAHRIDIPESYIKESFVDGVYKKINSLVATKITIESSGNYLFYLNTDSIKLKCNVYDQNNSILVKPNVKIYVNGKFDAELTKSKVFRATTFGSFEIMAMCEGIQSNTIKIIASNKISMKLSSSGAIVANGFDATTISAVFVDASGKNVDISGKAKLKISSKINNVITDDRILINKTDANLFAKTPGVHTVTVIAEPYGITGTIDVTVITFSAVILPASILKDNKVKLYIQDTGNEDYYIVKRIDTRTQKTTNTTIPVNAGTTGFTEYNDPKEVAEYIPTEYIVNSYKKSPVYSKPVSGESSKPFCAYRIDDKSIYYRSESSTTFSNLAGERVAYSDDKEVAKDFSNVSSLVQICNATYTDFTNPAKPVSSKKVIVIKNDEISSYDVDPKDNDKKKLMSRESVNSAVKRGSDYNRKEMKIYKLYQDIGEIAKNLNKNLVTFFAVDKYSLKMEKSSLNPNWWEIRDSCGNMSATLYFDAANNVFNYFLINEEKDGKNVRYHSALKYETSGGITRLKERITHIAENGTDIEYNTNLTEMEKALKIREILGLDSKTTIEEVDSIDPATEIPIPMELGPSITTIYEKITYKSLKNMKAFMTKTLGGIN